MPFFRHFEIDIVAALAEQLVTAFEELEQGALSQANIGLVPEEQGVYQLYRNGTLVYVGKADNLRSRLTQHRRKITGRRNIEIDEITFKCLTIHKNWTAFAPENSLIDHYKTQPGLCEWNGNGFGIHDPGRERETTNKHPDGFDSQFPIKEDWLCIAVEAGNWNVRDLLVRIKAELPFLLRYEAPVNYRAGHNEYNAVNVAIPQNGLPVTEILRLITGQLPGWQATRFPSHMILYKEHRDYTHGTIILQTPA